MLKALIRKQLLELGSFYFMNKKTGKRRSVGGIVGFSLIMVFAFVYLAFIFFSLAASIGSVMFAKDGGVAVYFAVFSAASVLFGVFGSVFRTYSLLYLAKDNKLLLSMPFPTGAILLSRLFTVVLTSFVYCAAVWIPAFAAYVIFGAPVVSGIVYSLLLLPVLTALVSALVCALGFFIAKIAVKLKNKSFLTVIIALAFISVYYVIMFRFGGFVTALIENIEAVGAAIKKWAFPFYASGLAASGDSLAMLAFAAGTILFFAAVIAVLSKTFIKVATAEQSERWKKASKTGWSNRGGIPAALFKKELKRFTSSSTYMLNSGFGLIILPIVTVVYFIKRDMFLELTGSLGAELGLSGVPLVAFAAIALFACGACTISASSVSLEGKCLWIAQSLPVDPYKVICAKYRLQVVLCSVSAIPCAVAVSALSGGGVFGTAALAALVLAYICFCSALGVVLNLLMPNLTWTNEMYPIKQSAPVLIVVLGGMIAAAIFAILWFFLHFFVGTEVYIAAAAVIFAAAAILLRLWLKGSGARRFAAL